MGVNMTIEKLDENNIRETKEYAKHYNKQDLLIKKADWQNNINAINARIEKIDELLSKFD